MPTSFLSLPLELRQMVYEKVLLVTEDDTQYRDHPTYNNRPHIPQPRPKLTTSLFTVSKQVSEEALACFYSENGFVVAEGFLHQTRECYIPMLTLTLDDGSTQLPLFRKYALMIRMEGAHEIDERYPSHFLRFSYPPETIVFAAKHLGLFMAQVSHAKVWASGHFEVLRQAPPAVKVGLTFNFNLRDGEHGFPQISKRNVDTIMDTLRNFKEFPISPSIVEGGKIAISIAGDIEPKLSTELMHSFRSPMQPQHLARDMELLLQEGNARRDGNYLLMAADGLYDFVRYVASSFQYYLNLVDQPEHDDWRKVLELTKVDSDIERSILCFKRYFKGHQATVHFREALESYKGLRYSQPSDDRLAQLHVLCGEMYLEIDHDQHESLGTLLSERVYRNRGVLCTIQALGEFREAQHYDPSSQKIVEKIQQCEERLLPK